MQYPNIIVAEMIKQYTRKILNIKNDDKSLLYTSKAEIENHKGTLLKHKDIINDLSNKYFSKKWEITNFSPTEHLSKDGFKCYELIPDMNDWNSILVILPPNPSRQQKEEWKQFYKNIEE